MGKYYRKNNSLYTNNYNYYQNYHHYTNSTCEISYHNENYRRLGNGSLKTVNHWYISTNGSFNYNRILLPQGDELTAYNRKPPNYSYHYNYNNNYDRYNYI